VRVSRLPTTLRSQRTRPDRPYRSRRPVRSTTWRERSSARGRRRARSDAFNGAPGPFPVTRPFSRAESMIRRAR
jgi:hypothetical protein